MASNYNPSNVPQNPNDPPTPTADATSPGPVQSPGGSSGQPALSGRHPMYRGIRKRSGKWVSEIREPRKTTRIWLGTYPTPEMAAAAYDAAALALKGHDTALNFPNSRLTYPTPASASASDIRAAAASAAEAARVRTESESSSRGAQQAQEQEQETNVGTTSRVEEEFVDEEELLNMPNLLVDMAGGMLVSPPRIESNSSSDESGGGGDNLWSYT
ncbi:hypothetical protein SO802_024125 [Lithocarpus litseifolius]|uniref:AP2/ERF domain-containing protein n=1 Tax=Lithocarpus litseifolius TaxID=425828 RepID=A0AAW2C8J8_9ROSI